MKFFRLFLIPLISCLLFTIVEIRPNLYFSGIPEAQAQNKPGGKAKKKKSNTADGRNRKTGKKPVVKDPGLAKYAIYQKTAPRPQRAAAVETSLPLNIAKGSRIAFIGNTLFDRAQDFAYFEAFLHQHLPDHELEVRNLTWSADSIETRPRPANFADSEQHLTLAKADIIFAAYGFNESFAGKTGVEDFRKKLAQYVADLKTKAFNGKTAARIVLVSPIANENIKGVKAADLNNTNIKLYTAVIQQVASSQDVGYANTYSATETAMTSPGDDLTINGVHLNARGYEVFSKTLFKQVIGENPPAVNESLRQAVIEKNKQFFYRYRPVNTFYYTGGRNRSYGYLDFLPAMRNFDIMVANRDKRIWALARGRKVPKEIDDSNVPPLPQTTQSRGANRWMSPADEKKAFKVDPRFEVNLFAGEVEFPELACPIQMRWDSRGRLWVSCSTTYPHVYPGNEPNDKIVILEDTDKDGKADKSTVYADDLHIPLSFVLGDGGVYVSEEPHLTFIKDTDGDGKADYRRKVFTGFGCEDSHHALHDFVWSPDGDIIFRESIFHHTQVETAYGPVRQQNSGWFRFEPRSHRLTPFGTYHSTNPWGVTFDDWGQHVASHPIYAQAFHSLDPVYPKQHPKPAGLRAYSGTCGQEFVDFKTFPEELQGGYIKARYKPTNRIEFHRWKETEFGYDEEYVSDIIFSSNLSFIPVDIRFGPRGAMYVADWYNPVKGHAQYSLRDERRDRHSGRIWRITAKGKKLQDPPKIHGASVAGLVKILERPEYR
ncbi:MAG: PVC-type heme-binding CxxCH protein, partial [Planctomycetota bacterium]|nr:PVC-type heme-binding CxxCH protein [Planctomycetota bacterium]